MRVALVALTLALLAWLAANIMDAASHPTPQTLEASEGAAVIVLSADRTRFVFPGECSMVRWRVGGIRAVHFYSYPVTGEGEQVVCHGDAPYLRVRLQDESERIYTLNRDVLFLHLPIHAAALLALGTGSLALYLFGVSRWFATRPYLTALLIAVAFVAILDLYTNSAYIIIGPTFDAARTLEIARNGWLGNPNVLAPWAYRPVTPLLARAISDLLGQPLDTGFAALAYAGAVAQLMLVFALARRFGAGFRAAIVTMLVVGLSFFNLRFLLYDIYRPDHLAYPMMLLALLALFRRQFVLCLLVSCIGILTREFLVIPAALLALTLLGEGVRERSWRKLAGLVVVMIAVGSVIALPRALIPVADSAQRFDPLNRPDAFVTELLFPWLNVSRNYEFLAVATSYLLPILVLATPARLRRAWIALAPYRGLLAAYIVMVILLTMYGGGDVHRYFSYMFVIQGIILAIWLRDAGWLEIVLMLGVVAVANRMFWMIDVDPIASVLWIGSIVEPSLVTQRLMEVAVYVAGAIGLRLLVGRLRASDKQIRTDNGLNPV